mmetsp:Transcript_4057/g.6766  ORF Transcript_4057/g.6766 Transcript_4057/m.6766 type:complete len:1035 (+) Transcript_4057:3-3107(+)|eukprot:CAMPEP_0119310364 /NCGR_PEP_ID=MMETSP1333-20130426/19039_1 /TAXON_ID=418940 /ORGANISM="Scyphosphaera apsteinii, Strain RCC1455" /LENGTH=1034 /DNA_ID=CAMNT_0007314537 /DNA_START=123 /DNA_END=3227 /DNA_ORIENTATION=-
MGEVSINPVIFWERLAKLHKSWTSDREANGIWKGADALVVDTGAANEDMVYSKSGALHTWLLGYEFTDTVFVFCSRSIHVLTASKKVQHLVPLKTAENATLPLELLTKEKNDNVAQYAALVQAIKSSHTGALVAVLGKEDPLGQFAKGWRQTLEAENTLQRVELGPALARLLAVKDTTEQGMIKRAAVFSAVVMTKQLVQRIEAVIDEEERVSHEKLAEETDQAFSEPAKYGVKLQPDNLESCYTPIIQSGGKFDLKPSAFSDDKNLHSGTITCSLGARYKSYCSNVGRTFIINPTKEQENNYKLLVELQGVAIQALRPDVKMSAVANAVQQRLKSKAPALESHLTKNCGFVTGLEFREASLVLSTKCDAVVRTGMVFNVALGLENLTVKGATDDRSKKYALFLADTVLVTDGGAAEVLTDRSHKEWKDVSYSIQDEDDGDDPPGVAAGSSSRRGNVEIKESRTRGASAHQKHEDINERLQSHQNELEEKMHAEALRRLADDNSTKEGSTEVQQTAIAYSDPDKYPNSSATGGAMRTNQTFVDGKAEAVLFPMNGRLVPFHVSTIKSVSKTEEGSWTFLRINFNAPGAGGFGASQQVPPEAGSHSHFIKEITLKARSATNLNNTFRLIKELRKRVQARDKQVALEADLITQDALQLIRTGKIQRLREVNVRPTLGGRKAQGVLELHSNGVRFQSARGEKIDLIFKNVKLAFFQPADKDILVLIHFHLHNPIMMGKKKTKDVQFYVEVMESSYALDNHRRSGYDPDELEEEQRERALRNRMNQEFQHFVKKVEEQADLEFDIPYRELGFYGVPPHGKAISFIMPGVNALVELTEPPWFVVPLNDIEVAHFERVVYGLKNFDLVLVLKDFTQKPVQVNAINMDQLDALKTWLDSCNIKFYEGTANLNWTQIMKHITDMGVEAFYEEDGWKFLNMNAGEEGSGEEGGSSDQESDFEPSESDDEEEEEEESDYEDEDSDDDDAEESLGSDESEGQDWDEAEEEAEKADKQRSKREAEEAAHPKAKKPKSKRRDDSDED